jgi:hypothetical protein
MSGRLDRSRDNGRNHGHRCRFGWHLGQDRRGLHRGLRLRRGHLLRCSLLHRLERVVHRAINRSGGVRVGVATVGVRARGLLRRGLLHRLGLFRLLGARQTLTFCATTETIGLRLDERRGVTLDPHTHRVAERHHLCVRHSELFRELVHT